MTYLCGNLQMPIKVWGKMQAARTCHFAKIPRRFLGGDLHLLRQREVRHFLRGVQYWPYAHKVMWKVPHLSSGKRQSLSPVSTTSSLLPSFTTHWTKIGFWRLISLTWNFTGKNAISDGSSSIQSSPKNLRIFQRTQRYLLRQKYTTENDFIGDNDKKYQSGSVCSTDGQLTARFFFSPYTNVDFRPITFLRTNLICIRHFQVHKLPVGQADRWSGEVGGKTRKRASLSPGDNLGIRTQDRR